MSRKQVPESVLYPGAVSSVVNQDLTHFGTHFVNSTLHAYHWSAMHTSMKSRFAYLRDQDNLGEMRILIIFQRMKGFVSWSTDQSVCEIWGKESGSVKGWRDPHAWINTEYDAEGRRAAFDIKGNKSWRRGCHASVGNEGKGTEGWVRKRVSHCCLFFKKKIFFLLLFFFGWFNYVYLHTRVYPTEHEW